MKLYLLSQSVNRGHYTYDSCVVAAEDAQQARFMLPGGGSWEEKHCNDWAFNPTQVEVRLLGTAVDKIEAGVICSSFNE